MTQEDLRSARIAEARRRAFAVNDDSTSAEHLADLYETNWTPPEPVDPDLLAFNEWAGAVSVHRLDREVSLLAYLAGIKHGRGPTDSNLQNLQSASDQPTPKEPNHAE